MRDPGPGAGDEAATLPSGEQENKRSRRVPDGPSCLVMARRSSHLAVGHWSRDLHCRILQEQTPDKIKELLEDKLIAMGRPVELWLPVASTDEGVIACTCDKDTRPGSDFRCLSCHGMRSVPGYWRFLHELIYAASAEYADFTLTNVIRDLSKKPNRLRLATTALTGTIVTNDKAFANPLSEDWTYRVAAFRKTDTDVIDAEFSTDAGVTWSDITELNGTNKPAGNGSIRFRVTLTRASLTTDSPDFEILRIQRRMPENMTGKSKVRKDLLPGQILILRTWVIEQTIRQLAAGRQTEFSADKAWTSPLDFFDKRITANTPACKIDDRGPGQHPFYEHAFGIDEGSRFPIYQMTYNEQLLTFTHQSFFDRRAQTNEAYSLVF